MFAKKIVSLIAAVSMMTVGAVACAETTVNGNEVQHRYEGEATAYVEDAMVCAEASYAIDSSVETFEYGTLNASIEKAEAGVKAGVSTTDGKTTVECKAGAEALIGEFGGTVGTKDTATVGAEFKIGVGGHFDVGYEDGHVKLDVGAALGIGAGFSLDVNVGGIWKTIRSWF